MSRDLSDLEKDALLSFREQKGHQYKSILKSCWVKSNYPGRTTDHAAALQRIRNEFGPVWLDANGNQCTSDRKLAIQGVVNTFIATLHSQLVIPDGHAFQGLRSDSLRWYLDDIVESAHQVSGWIVKPGAETSDQDQFSAEFRYKYSDNSAHVFASAGNQYAFQSQDMIDYAGRNACFVYADSPVDAANKCAAVWNDALTHWQEQCQQKSESQTMSM